MNRFGFEHHLDSKLPFMLLMAQEDHTDHSMFVSFPTRLASRMLNGQAPASMTSAQAGKIVQYNSTSIAVVTAPITSGATSDAMFLKAATAPKASPMRLEGTRSGTSDWRGGYKDMGDISSNPKRTCQIFPFNKVNKPGAAKNTQVMGVHTAKRRAGPKRFPHTPTTAKKPTMKMVGKFKHQLDTDNRSAVFVAPTIWYKIDDEAPITALSGSVMKAVMPQMRRKLLFRATSLIGESSESAQCVC